MKIRLYPDDRHNPMVLERSKFGDVRNNKAGHDKNEKHARKSIFHTRIPIAK